MLSFCGEVAYADVAVSNEVNHSYNEERNADKGNFNELIENNESIIVDKLIEENLEVDTGIINEENEKELNRKGVLDDEIEEYSDEVLDMLSNECYSIEVKVNYYTYDENNEFIDCTKEEIEEYYIETGMVDEADKVGVLGKKQISAKAKSLGDTDTSNSGMFRETLCLMQTKKGDNVYVTYNGTWLKTPQNRGCDIVGIAVDNLTPIKNTIICKYYYALSQYSAAYSNGVREISGSRNLNFDNGATYVITKFNFYTSNAQDNMAAAGNVYNSYKTNRVYIFFRASRKFDSQKYCGVYSDYFHEKTEVNITPSLVVGGEGLSFSIAPSIHKYYQHMTSNACIERFYFK